MSSMVSHLRSTTVNYSRLFFSFLFCIFFRSICSLTVGNKILFLFVGKCHKEDCENTSYHQQDKYPRPAPVVGNETEQGVSKKCSTKHIAHKAGQSSSGASSTMQKVGM